MLLLKSDVWQDGAAVEQLQLAHGLLPQLRLEAHRNHGRLLQGEDHQVGPLQARHGQLTLDLGEVTVAGLQSVLRRLDWEEASVRGSEEFLAAGGSKRAELTCPGCSCRQKAGSSLQASSTRLFLCLKGHFTSRTRSRRPVRLSVTMPSGLAANQDRSGSTYRPQSRTETGWPKASDFRTCRTRVT